MTPLVILCYRIVHAFGQHARPCWVCDRRVLLHSAYDSARR